MYTKLPEQYEIIDGQVIKRETREVLGTTETDKEEIRIVYQYPSINWIRAQRELARNSRKAGLSVREEGLTEIGSCLVNLAQEALFLVEDLRKDNQRTVTA